MTLRDFEQDVVRCCVVKKEFSEKEHIMEAISGLSEDAIELCDYIETHTDFLSDEPNNYDRKEIREALGEVLFDFVYLYETLGIPIEEIMDATEGGME